MSDLLKICMDNKVGIIIPTIDTQNCFYTLNQNIFLKNMVFK